MTVPKGGKVVPPTEDEILHAFRLCNSLDIAALKENCPAVADVVEQIARTLCVSWECVPKTPQQSDLLRNAGVACLITVKLVRVQQS